MTSLSIRPAERTDALRDEDIHRYVAGYTLPNPASAAHERFGFKHVGIFSEVGEILGCAWNERPGRLE